MKLTKPGKGRIIAGVILLVLGIFLTAQAALSPLSLSGSNNWITVYYCNYKDAHTLVTQFTVNTLTTGFQCVVSASGGSSQETLGLFDVGITTTTLTTTTVDLTGYTAGPNHYPSKITYRDENVSSSSYANSLTVDVTPVAYSHVTVTSIGHGTTNPTGSITGTYMLGAVLYVTAAPSAGWMLSVMQRNGVNWTSANPGGFLNLAATESITVIFVPNQNPVANYSLVTITVQGQGTTNPTVGSYSQTYHIADSISITATPSEGWAYNLTKRNGVAETGSNPAEIANLGTSENIEVIFTEVSAPPPPPILSYIELIGGIVSLIATAVVLIVPIKH